MKKALSLVACAGIVLYTVFLITYTVEHVA